MIENKFIVFAVDHFSSLGVIRCLGEAGIRPDVILFSVHKPKLVQYSKYIAVLHHVRSLEEGYKCLVDEYVNEGTKPFVLATSDEVESCLDIHYDELKDKFYFYHAQEQGRVTKMMQKHVIVEMAKRCGLRIPKTEIVSRGESSKMLNFPILTKAPTSTIHNWKNNVFICHNEDELQEAYKHIKCEKVLLQEYIEKQDELNVEGFCIDGGDAYFTLQNRYHRITNKSYGNYAYIEKYSYPELEQAIRRLFRETHYSGMFELEFMIGKDGKCYFLEINFRNSAWLYAYSKCGQPLLMMWAKSVLYNKIITEDENIRKLPFNLMDEITDFKWSVMSGIVPPFTWLKESLGSDCHFYYNKQDARPFYMYLWNRFWGLLK